MNMIKRKYKRSRQRDHIYKLLKNTDKHPTAGWIYDQLIPEFANLSMGTVYRNINILIDQSLIQKIENGSTYDRYDANTEPHYHFVCHQCDTIDDMPVGVFENLNEEISQITGYQVESHRLHFYGNCPECIKKETKQMKNS